MLSRAISGTLQQKMRTALIGEAIHREESERFQFSQKSLWDFSHISKRGPK